MSKLKLVGYKTKSSTSNREEAGEVCLTREERNLQQRRTGRTSNIENIIEDASELHFDELELVTKMTISSKTHKEKNQTRTKKDDARMQWFELSTNDMIKLLIESPP